jgi:hypothetical protein
MVTRNRPLFWGVPCAALAVLGSSLTAGCKPDLVGRASLIQEDTLLAVSASPAESEENADVTYTSLYVGPKGPVDAASFDWAFCDERKPLAVTGSIAPLCLVPRGKVLTPIGVGGTVTGHIAADTPCKTFGPFAIDPVAGQPTPRPADPDTTGGFYQPLRVRIPLATGDSYTVVTTRLDCGLTNATQEQSIAYAKSYLPNENPKLDALTLTRSGAHAETVPPDGAAPSLTLKPGEHVDFDASWADCAAKTACTPCDAQSGADGGTNADAGAHDGGACSSTCAAGAPAGCTGSESYPYLDPVSHELVPRREAIRVSWYATDGDFDHDRTGRTEQEAEAKLHTTDNDWTAPNIAGVVHVWVVIRDDRGGVAWSSYLLNVAP